MATLLFHTGLIDDRGSIAATSEYIGYLQNEGHHVIWAYDKLNPGNRSSAISHYKKMFNLEHYVNFNQYSISVSKRIDWVYFSKKGLNDGLLIPSVKNAIHVMFNVYQPHGDTYAYVSKWLADASSRQANFFIPKGRSKIPNPFVSREWVPFGVDMPPPTNSLRAEWGVPLDARVCIRLGGENTFDIPWVHKTIKKAITEHQNFYFIGYNTNKFIDHPRAIFLPSINGKIEKSNALMSADIFLHARRQGESFGMAILEAMRLKVPVLAWAGGWDRNHTKILHKESLYKNELDLYHKLMHGISDHSVSKSFDNSNLYLIPNVMQIFKDKFEINNL